MIDDSATAADSAPRDADVHAHGVRLLDVEPDLGAGLASDALAEARRHAILPVCDLAPGDTWELGALAAVPGVREPVHGLLVISGTLALDVIVAGRACLRVIAPGEILLLDRAAIESIDADWGTAVLEAAQVAVLDQRLLSIGRRWPALLSAIVFRAASQTRLAHLQQAISQLPRVEDRLLALFWSLGDRFGIARADGIAIRLALTHDTIAAMIGARRPTVTLGLSALSEEGLLVRHGDEWLLSRRSARMLSNPDETRAQGHAAHHASGPQAH